MNKMNVNESPFDLEFMIQLTEEIAKYQEELAKIKLALDVFKAEITQKVTTDENYWVGGKSPSMAFITSNYHVLGYDEDSRNTLLGLNYQAIDLDAKLTKAKTRFTVEREKLDIWRTFSANARGTVSFLES